MHIVRRVAANKIFTLAAIVFIALLASLVTGKFAFAADPSITNKTCYSKNNALMTNRTSPFSQTEGMCLGDGEAGRRYYQFGVTIDTPTAVRANVTARAGNTSISFRKVTDFLYVSDTSYENGMGYGAVTGTSASCNRSDPANSVRISADANGKSEAITVNLCDYTSADATLVYKKTTQLKDNTGQGASTGKILANLGIQREGAPSGHGARQGTLEKVGVTSIKLTGGENLSGNSSSSWYNLSGGALQIKNDGGVAPGFYTLEITYNDKLLANLSDPKFEPDWTTENLVIRFPQFEVKAGEDKYLTASDGTITYYNANGETVNDKKADEESKTTCVIDGVGWIVCGLSKWLAQVMDGIYGLLTLYLTTPTVNTDIKDKANTLYRVWSVMRNLANVAFVIAFLIIIFSQLTGAGINNYGIKKVLPRLIVAAILVNVSYWIAAAAVDLSNILGNGIYNLIRAISDNLGGITVPGNVWEITLTALLAGGGVAVAGGTIAAGVGAVSAGVIAGSTLAMAALWVAIPAVLAGILAVIIAFAILAARQALIIILIVLSPLAFVALLLPNTEGFFKTWRKSLITMLIFYPIFSVIFAGSQLAAMIILGAAAGSSSSSTTSGPVGHIIVLALFIQVIPLIMTPLLVKFSGGLIGQLAGIVNNKGKGLIDRSRKVRDRKLGLAANEIMSNAARVGGRNPFARTARFMGRTYRRSQNDNRVDADRQKILDSQNQGAYLGTDRAAQLSTSLKNAQHQVNTLEGEHNAEFEAQKDVDMTYRLNLANQKVDVRKLQDQMDYKKTLSSQTNIAGTPNAGMINEARNAERDLNMYRDAVGRTDNVLKQEYADELLNRPGLANLAAGIDANGGAEKVKATAIEAQQKAYQANVSAFSVLHRHDGHNNTELDLRSRNTNLSIEEREAASRSIVESGDIDAITEHQNYLATALASARTPEELENVKALQKAFGNSIGSSPGKPVGLGAADIAKYKVGNYIAPSSTHDINVEYDLTTNSYTSVAPRPMDPTEIQTLDTIEQKGISMDKWTGMDKADIIRTINLASSGAVSSQRQRDMATSIDETLGDKRWYGRMQEREINLLKELRSRLP